MQLINQLLQVSANLFKLLGDIPNGEERDEYIDNINSLLDKRGKIIEDLVQEGFKFDEQNRIHRMLLELDNGIIGSCYGRRKTGYGKLTENEEK